jgi:hypothetical protein
MLKIEWYLAIEMNKILKYAETWMNHEIIMVSERRKSEMATCSVFHIYKRI